jgi:hypothetical protein
MTNEERQELLKRGLEIRRIHSEYREKIKEMEVHPLDIINRREKEEELARMRIEYLLKSIPGIGKVKTKRIMKELHADKGDRLEDLNTAQTIIIIDNLPETYEEYFAGTTRIGN